MDEGVARYLQHCELKIHTLVNLECGSHEMVTFYFEMFSDGKPALTVQGIVKHDKYKHKNLKLDRLVAIYLDLSQCHRRRITNEKQGGGTWVGY